MNAIKIFEVFFTLKNLGHTGWVLVVLILVLTVNEKKNTDPDSSALRSNLSGLKLSEVRFPQHWDGFLCLESMQKMFF